MMGGRRLLSLKGVIEMNYEISTQVALLRQKSTNRIQTPFRPLERWDDDRGRRMAMKTNIRNILDSYAGTYDFVAEPVQNAVDEVEYALRLFEMGQAAHLANTPTGEYEPVIWVIVDAMRNQLSVIDNGPGMTVEQAMRFVYPSYTEKREKSRQIHHTLRGHKGVGSTYLAYGFNYIRVSSKGPDGMLSMCLSGGRNWALSDTNDPEPLAEPAMEDIPAFHTLSTGTAVTIRFDESTQPSSLTRLGSSAERWALILRANTALGFIDIRNEQNWQEKLTVVLTYIDREGNESLIDVPPVYLFPHLIKGFDWLDLAQFYRQHRETVEVPRNCQDMDGVYRIWKGDDLVQTGTGLARGIGFDDVLACEPVVYAAFTHSSRLWDSLTEALTSDKRLKVIRPGVWVVSSNAITGRSISVEPSYGAGNVDRLHMLVDLKDVRPDLGRKGFNPAIEEQIRKMAENAISYFVARRKGFLKPAGVQPGESHRRLDLYRKLKKAEERLENNPLNIALSIAVVPEQEPEVIEMFGELRGLGVIIGYQLIGGYHSDTYDLVLRYRVRKDDPRVSYDSATNPLGLTTTAFGSHEVIERPPFLGEYKISLDGLVEELACREEAKSFDELDLVVTWEIGKRWRKEYDLVAFGTDISVSKREFYGATHVLSRKGVSDGHTVSVICLKTVVGMIEEGLITLPGR